MRTIGFVGLGTMGAPMALNVLDAGYEVVLYNRTRSRAESLAEGRSAAVVAESPKEVARQADIVITMLSDDAAVENAYFGEGGLFEGALPGTILIDSSTVSPALSLQLAAEAQARSVDFLDAPVTGSKPAAERGELTFIVGGHEQTLAAVRDVLAAMGRGAIHMGPHGSGARAKLAHNAIVAVHAAALAESLAIAAKAGVDPAKFLDVAGSGGAASKMLELKREKLLQREFSSQFALKLMLKDLRLASALADDLGVPAPVLASVKELYRIGESRGLGELDLSAIVQCYEEWADLSIGSRQTPTTVVLPAGGTKASAAADAGKSGEAREDDRRRAPRVMLNIPLQISVYQWEQEGSFSGQQINATLFDLSKDGLQVRSSFPLAADMFVVIHFPQDADLPPITGRIIRVVPDGDEFRYGCLLSGLPPYVRAQLEGYLQRRLES